MKVCKMCDRGVKFRSRTQRFCSHSCAGLYLHAVNPRPRKPGARQWSVKTAEQKAAYSSSQYRRARQMVVTAAIGTPCPGCGQTLTRQNCQADHRLARAE